MAVYLALVSESDRFLKTSMGTVRIAPQGRDGA